MTSARRRAGTVHQLWWRAKGLATRTRERIQQRWHNTPDAIALDDVRRRLELLLVALHGRTIRINAAPVQAPTWMDRAQRAFTPRHLRERPMAWTDGDAVLLPPTLPHRRGDPAGVTHYRMLALVQAERVARGSARMLPLLTDPLQRDLFLLREAMTIEARVARDVSSVAGALDEARRAALASRPPQGSMSEAERQVEAIVREALHPDAAHRHQLLADSTPEDSLVWAHQTRSAMRGTYAGIAPVPHWGGMTDRSLPPARDANPFAERDGIIEIELDTVSPDGEGAASDRADPNRAEDDIEDERGVPTPDAAADPSSDATAASASDTSPAATTPSSNSATTPPPTNSDVPDDPGPGVTYPEWDDREQRYRRDAATVRERVADEADTTWAADTLRANAPIVRRIRERFEPLRAQRMRLNQQRDGEELDLQACIQAMVDARTGHTPSDRLYLSVRPARRAMTICLLVDVSGSTEQQLASGQRIVDVEREAVLLASEAFDVLGDDYALLTFSSRGGRNVRIGTLKDFQERNGTAVRRRIGSIEPGNNTRLGAAVRHATARLSQQPQGRRLLLMLSDGRPNDFDGYYETVGVEDSRQAINEARAQGVIPFCLTIDREDGPEYLPRIFGPTGYTVLREPEQLPLALVRVVRQLLAT